MFLLLFRQLILPLQPSSQELAKMKQEINDIKVGSLNPVTRVQDITLQICLRASQISNRNPTQPSPDRSKLALGVSWTESHILTVSSVTNMMRDRLKSEVFCLLVHACSARMGNSSVAMAGPPGAEVGMVGDEVKALVDRLSRVAAVHMGVYLGMYEKQDLDEAPTLPAA